jgi:alkylhydroperoxidase family enzyme
MDINAAGGSEVGISQEKIAAVGDYQENPLFTPRERAALRYAEEMSQTSVEVPDQVFEDLKRYFDDKQIIALTAEIALENYRARFNRALQVESDGFCALPPNHPALQQAHRHPA